MEHPFPFGKGMNLAFTPIRCERAVDRGLAVGGRFCFFAGGYTIDEWSPSASWMVVYDVGANCVRPSGWRWCIKSTCAMPTGAPRGDFKQWNIYFIPLFSTERMLTLLNEYDIICTMKEIGNEAER